MQCRFKYCDHESKEIKGNDYVKIGKAYYHKDCYEKKENVKKIIDYYSNNVETNPVYSLLTKTVNDLVFKNGVDSKYLLFALRYAHEHRMINHVPGLRYLPNNQAILKEWNKPKPLPHYDIVADEIEKPDGYQYKTTKSGFGRILKT